MSYYMGDFYRRGDFYRGDPGFFGFLGGLAKRAVGLIPGVGPIASTALSVIPRGGKLARLGIHTGEAVISKAATAGRVLMRHPIATGAALSGAGLAAAGAAGLMHRRGAGVPSMRRHRRMHVTNVKALRRAIRRCHGFASLAKRVLRFTHPKAATGRVTFKPPTKKKKVC